MPFNLVFILIVWIFDLKRVLCDDRGLVGVFSMDSLNAAQNTAGFVGGFGQPTGFQNLETNFFQFGASLGANLIFSETFVGGLAFRAKKIGSF